MKDLNIVFVNYFCKDDILHAIDSVCKDLAESKHQVQITVVDNSNNEDSIGKDLHHRFSNVKYINIQANIGFGAANTVGFKATPARHYFALNRDTVIPENMRVIDRMIEFMDTHQKIGAIGPKLVNMDGSLQYSCYRFDLPSMLIKPFKQIHWDKKYPRLQKYANRQVMKDFAHNETRPVDWVIGAAMMVRSEVLTKVGSFDEKYFMYLEDADWCKRMWERGFPVYYVHDIVIKHKHNRSSAQVPGIIKPLFTNRLARIHLMSWLKYMWTWRKTFKYYA